MLMSILASKGRVAILVHLEASVRLELMGVTTSKRSGKITTQMTSTDAFC